MGVVRGVLIDESLLFAEDERGNPYLPSGAATLLRRLQYSKLRVALKLVVHLGWLIDQGRISDDLKIVKCFKQKSLSELRLSRLEQIKNLCVISLTKNYSEESSQAERLAMKLIDEVFDQAQHSVQPSEDAPNFMCCNITWELLRKPLIAPSGYTFEASAIRQHLENGICHQEDVSPQKGETGKMSASDPNSAIYVTDSSKDIKNKVNRYAFSGGQDSIENHRKYGANLEVDIPIKYLGFFLDDDAELDHIKKEYGAGRMFTGEVKKRLIEVLSELVERHRKARAAVTDEMVDAFMAVRPLPNMFS